MKDLLGDRMKLYEQIEAGRKFMPKVPIMARMDGRSFHNFTKGMTRPYDAAFSECMIETTKYLVQETGACMGYTQSDEITLVWYSENLKSQVWFDGKISKMTSQLAAQTTLAFYLQVREFLSEKYAAMFPTFDARVWTVPNKAEAANAFLWREWDATKNSITMAASSVFSHKELQSKNGSEKQDMLMQAGINWNDYPAFFKRGTYVQRKKVLRPFSATEIEALPAKHQARVNPNLLVSRSAVEVLDMQKFSSVSNKEEVIFDGAEPIYNL